MGRVEDPFECLPVNIEINLIECDDHKCSCGAFATFKEKLLEHRRRGHFHDPKVRFDHTFFCPDCALSKAKASSHSKIRPEKYFEDDDGQIFKKIDLD